MHIRRLLALGLIGPVASACTANPVFPDHDEEFTAEVVFSVVELATLSEFAVTVHVEDHAGEHVTAMAEVRVEFQHHNDTEWTGVVLKLPTSRSGLSRHEHPLPPDRSSVGKWR